MSQAITPTRAEPITDPGPAPTEEDLRSEELRAAVTSAPAAQPYAYEAAPERPVSSVQELLARLEDKTARIEEKLSRSEAFTARVIDRFEASSHRMSEVAQQSELAAVRSETKFIARRVRSMPGFAALVLTSAITAVLTAVILIILLRFLPGLLGR